MKVKFIGKVEFTSRNVTYIPDETYEVRTELVNKFPKLFKKLEEEKTKPAPKPKPKPVMDKKD